MDGVREQDEDAAWRAIVDNYGERATLNDPPAEVETEPEAVLPEQAEDQTQPESIADRPDDPPYSAILDAPEENFVPPPAPPLPSPRGPVGMAWLGLLGSPALLLIFVLTGNVRALADLLGTGRSLPRRLLLSGLAPAT